MKKLALVFASLALAATPVLACPHSDSAKDSAPQTAEKAKDNKDQKSTDQAKAKTAPAKTESKDKQAKPEAKPAKTDKVSQR